MLSKEKVLDAVKNLLERFTLEDLFERIVLLQKIEIGLEQSRNGQVTPPKRQGKNLKNGS